MIRKPLTPIIASLVWMLASCATSGPIETIQADSQQPVVPSPSAFNSPLNEIEQVRQSVEESENQLPPRPNLRGRDWHHYVGFRQAEDSAAAEQDFVENEIEQIGQIVLTPGASYSIDLESYCINAGKARPTTGDGLRLGLLRGPGAIWIAEILKTQGTKGASQERVQYLIWALLSDVRFDELDPDDQAVLLRFYPDAAVRFGNRRLEGAATGAFQSLFPDVASTISSLSELRERVLSLRGDFARLETALAPESGRSAPIPVGWLRMDEGYLVHATANGYSQIHFDIYVPPVQDRAPSVAQELIFRPWQWVGLPDQGQRLAVSTKVIRKPARKHGGDCDRLKSWKPSRCHSLSAVDQKAILQAADPKNFPQARYQSPPRVGVKAEQETDCSNFVNEIYHRAGFDYPYASTSVFPCLTVFQPVGGGDAQSGDLILYRGHVGILDRDGNVISATWGGRQKRSMLPPNSKDFIPAIRALPKNQVHPGPWKILRWSCP